ncbi:MAG: chaperone NapD [Ideonella sp.]|nr:chaperone NapD [Ideonella sp.]
MSILGVVVRTHPAHIGALRQSLRDCPGADVALDPGDGRLILVIEDTPGQTAAAALGLISGWPAVLNTSLVYEYSGPDAPDAGEAVADYTDWRAGLTRLAQHTANS